MEDKDISAMIEKAVAAALAAEHATHDHACAAERQRRAWRRRFALIAAVICATGAVAYVMHMEALHESLIVAIDGFVACSLDKFIFGIAEI